MATSGDLDLTTHGDFLMATDTVPAAAGHSAAAPRRLLYIGRNHFAARARGTTGACRGGADNLFRAALASVRYPASGAFQAARRLRAAAGRSRVPVLRRSPAAARWPFGYGLCASGVACRVCREAVPRPSSAVPRP